MPVSSIKSVTWRKNYPSNYQGISESELNEKC